jgi:hypothetical protein
LIKGLNAVFCQSVAKRLGADRLKKSTKKLVKDWITALIESKKPGDDAVKKADEPRVVRESVVVVEDAVAVEPLVGESVVGELEVGGKSAVEESIVGERDLQQATAQQAAAREEEVEGTRKRRMNLKGYSSKSARKWAKRNERMHAVTALAAATEVVAIAEMEGTAAAAAEAAAAAASATAVEAAMAGGNSIIGGINT